MALKDIRSVIDGFDDTRAEMAELAQTGSDFVNEGARVKAQVNALHPKRLTLTVSEVVAETPTTRTLRLTSDAGDLPPFLAGQYVNLFVTVDGVETARPFAISSAPQERTHYDLTVRKLAGGFVSPWLVEGLQAGAKVSSSGPMGSFYVNPIHHGDDLVFLAGGSGVAPAISIIRDLAARGTDAKFHLIYGSRNADDIIFEAELAALAKAHDFLTVSTVISEPDDTYEGRIGFIDGDLMADLCGDMAGKTVYLCGPPAMNAACATMLREIGVPDKRLHIEANGPPVDPTARAGWPEGVDASHPVTVTVKGRGSFETTAGEPLLNALEKAGFQIENACRSGECSLCRIKVLSGDVFNPSEAKLRQSDRRFGWVHSCVAYATSDVEILL